MFSIIFIPLSHSLAQQTSYQETFIMPSMNGDIFVIETSDGGFITTGQDESSGAGSCDIYIFKKDACGKLVWFKTYGGGGADGGTCIQQTTDGGYVVSGLFTLGSNYDMALLKIDGNGNLQWFKTFGDGGGADEYGLYVWQTTDGGYILTGHTRSFGAGAADIYVVKTDNAGNMQWEKTYGGGGEDVGNYVQQTADGGYILSAATNSFGSGGYDILLIKIDSLGTVLWSKVYGGTGDDGTWWIVRSPVTSDGGYLISSYTNSFGAGAKDIFLIKTDSAGTLLWAKTYGGPGDEESRFGTPVAGGNIICTGYTTSFGAGGQDYFLLLTDSAGNLQWFNTYGSTGNDKAMCAQAVSDGGYVLCGNTSSAPFSANYYDIYFVKTDSAGLTTCFSSPAAPTVNTVTPTVSTITPTTTSPTAVNTPGITVNNYSPALNRLCIQCYFEAKYTYCKNQLQLTMYDSSACLPTNWYWDFGDGYTATGQNPLHVYTTPGTYSIRMIAIDSTTFCLDTVIQSITVDTMPVSRFSFTDNLCFGVPVQFTDFSNGNIIGWNWDFGDGTYDTVQNPTHLYAAPGTYFAELRVVYDGYCTDSITRTVNVRPIPVAGFTATDVCRNIANSFSDQSSISTGLITAYSWVFGDGTGTSSALNPAYTYFAPGVYTVIHGVTSSYGCYDTVMKNVEVYPLPAAGFGAPEVCFGFPTQFSDSTLIIGDTLASWIWDYGDGNNGTGPSSQHIYSSPGIYLVELKAISDEGCADSLNKIVTVNPLPVAYFNFNPVCEYDSVKFYNASAVFPGTIIWNSWYFGDGDSSFATDPSHLYSDGIFSVTLGVTTAKGCFDDTVKNNIVVYEKPVADFNFISVCAKDTLFFSDASTTSSATDTVYSWTWNFGDASPLSNSKNPSHIYDSTGTYTVTLIVLTNKGCYDTVSKTVYIYPLPAAEFISNDTCFGFINNFSSNSTIFGSTIQTYIWDFDDGNFAATSTTFHTYSSIGTYDVELKVTTNDGCLDSITKPVKIFPVPAADFFVTPVCEENSAVFADSSKVTPPAIIASWTWTFGDGDSSVSQTPGHYYSYGYYVVNLEVTSGNGCVDTVQKGIVIFPEPAAGFSFIPECEGDTMTFSDISSVPTGSIAAWQWNFGDGTALDTTPSPTHIFLSDDIYTVTLIVKSDSGCNDTLSQSVLVYANPIAFFLNNSVCEGTQTLFNDSSFTSDTFIQYNWIFGDGIGTSTEEDPSYLYSSYDSFPVWHKVVTNFGCRDSLKKIVTVYSNPVVQIDADDKEGCVPVIVQFTDLSTDATGIINNWVWNFGDVTASALKGPLHIYDTSGFYTVTLIVSTTNNCSSTKVYSNYIEVYPEPVAAFSAYPQPTTILFPNITFTDLSKLAVDWRWYFGDSDSSRLQNPQHTYKDTGTYLVQLIIASPKGCTDTVFYLLYIEPDFVVFIPSAFSPNDDGVNEAFIVKGTGISEIDLQIFDRWGDEVYRGSGMTKGWDGKSNQGSKISQQDVYVYTIEIKDVLGKKHRYIGHVTLIK